MATTVSTLMPIGIFVICVGIILHIVGIASTQWASIDGPLKEMEGLSVGLFRTCYDSICTSISKPTDAQRISQGMAILACILSAAGVAIATVYSILVVNDKSPRVIFRRIAAICNIFAKVAVVICLILFRFTTYEDVEDEAIGVYGVKLSLRLGYGFYCSSLGGVAFLVGGIMLLMARGYMESYVV